jgi:transcriptional regulator with XRE-family HTH domain
VKSDATKHFGRRVRERREKLRLSQEDFADQVGLDRTYVSGIERGTRNPTLATMKRLAEGLGVPLETLLKGL